MRLRLPRLILAGLLLILILSVGACGRSSTPEWTPSVKTTQTYTATSTFTSIPPTPAPSPQEELPIVPTETLPAYPQPTSQGLPPTTYPEPQLTNTQIPGAVQTQAVTTPTATETSSPEPYPAAASPFPTVNFTPAYPQPQLSPTTGGYPGPQVTASPPGSPGPQPTASPPAYPGPGTATQQASSTPPGQVTSSPTPVQTGAPTGIFTPGTPAIELPPPPPMTPPPPGSAVTIWHAWGVQEVVALQSIIDSFQRQFPDVTFSLNYYPQDALFNAYRDAAYFGKGPTLLLGPLKWGHDLFDEALIADMKPYFPNEIQGRINKAALAAGLIDDALVSLPLSLRGQMMFRNSAIIADTPSDFDELIALSSKATHGGVVGSYLERGAFFSTPTLISLGGSLMDNRMNPRFNSEAGLEWIEVLRAYDEPGAVTLNTNYDLVMFKSGRTGIIIDGSWNMAVLANAIGTENLAIDAYPRYGDSQLSGWVEADGVFLNATTIEKDRFAALAFIGYLLDPNVQVRLAEVGHIPAVLEAQPRDRLIQQAMIALEDGIAYPNFADEGVLNIYWSELNTAIRKIFDEGTDPKMALQQATRNIHEFLIDYNKTP